MLLIPLAWHPHILINASHPQTWPGSRQASDAKKREKHLLLHFFPHHMSLPASQDKVYLQQSPAVGKEKLPDTSPDLFFLCFTSIRYNTFEMEAAWCSSVEKKYQLVVDCYSNDSIFHFFSSTHSGGSNNFSMLSWLLSGALPTAERVQCNAMWNVQCIPKIFCCTNSSTLTPFFFHTSLTSRVINFFTLSHSQCCLSHCLLAFTFQPIQPKPKLANVQCFLKVQIENRLLTFLGV